MGKMVLDSGEGQLNPPGAENAIRDVLCDMAFTEEDGVDLGAEIWILCGRCVRGCRAGHFHGVS